MKKLAFLLVCLSASLASAQFVRKDGTLQDALGRAMSQAQVYVCTQPCTSTSVPPSPLATIYSDSAGDASLFPGYVVTDGLGNYNYYFSSSGAPYTEVFVWHGTIVKVLVDQDTFGGGGSGFSFACPGALNGSMMATKTTTSASCDPLIGTDFNGNGFSQSWSTLGAFNGFYSLRGGAADPGTSATYLMPSNATRLLAPQTTTAPYSARLPSTPCAVGQVWNVTGVTTDGNGQEVDAYGCLTPGGNVSITATSPIVVTPSPITGTGVISCPTCNTGSTGSALNPSAPTVTPKGVTGATTYTYLVVGCEDVNCTKTSAASATGSTSTGNASLTTSNFNQLTAYADTLYGYRFFKVCRTVGGATQGVIASGVGKQYNDTGAAGDSTNCATTYSANNTILDQHCLGASLPVGVNVIPGAPCGVNAPPTSPNAFDDEFAWTLGAPGDANNPQWQQLNWGTSTAALTSGELIISPQNTVGGNAVRMLGTTVTLPATPWEFELKILPHLTTATGVVASQSGMCLYDGTKVELFGLDNRNSIGMSLVYLTNINTFSSTKFSTAANGSNIAYINYPSWIYLNIKDDGTNYTYSWSDDGVNFITLGTALTTDFLGAPTSIGPCMQNNATGNISMSVDFFRKKQ